MHFSSVLVDGQVTIIFVVSVCLSVCLSVCNVRALWPNGWTHQDETWRAGRPHPGDFVLDGDRAPHSNPIPIVTKRSPILATAELLLNFKKLIVYLITNIVIITVCSSLLTIMVETQRRY